VHEPAVLRDTERQQRPDAGFTLIEMLLCVALVGIIGGAIASSLLVMVSTQQRTTGMLAVSQDRQLVANYFNDDVAGATTVATGSQPVCGTTVNSLVVLTGGDSEPPTSSLPLPPAPVSATTTVAWSYVAGTPAGRLVRTSCRNGGTPATRTVAKNVATTPATSASCTSAVSLTGVPKPAQVSLTVPQVSGAPLVLCALRRPE
jgi:prepilin-type N-terminal cleavage/methylation domain-containing protein